jgi:hypothetical protein
MYILLMVFPIIFLNRLHNSISSDYITTGLHSILYNQPTNISTLYNIKPKIHHVRIYSYMGACDASLLSGLDVLRVSVVLTGGSCTGGGGAPKWRMSPCHWVCVKPEYYFTHVSS